MTEEERIRQERKARYAAKHREYDLAHKEEKRRWRLEHKDMIAASNKKYRETDNGRAKMLAARYRFQDSERGFDISDNITDAWIIENILHQKCVYCGNGDRMALGADRLDNNKPHTPENVVCSCWDCNNAKGMKYGPIEFQAMKFGSL